MRHTIKTVGDLMQVLWDYPNDYPVVIGKRFLDGDKIHVEHRELNGKQIINLWCSGHTSGPIGENPLTDEEYEKRSKEFLSTIHQEGYTYTSSYGDHRIVFRCNCGSCTSPLHYVYDKRIIERMVAEGLIPWHSVDIDKVRRTKTW